jgi:hypothetical protein
MTSSLRKLTMSPSALGVVDQVINSGSNAVFAVLAARSLSVAGFGDLAIGQLVYFIVIINVVRPIGEALVVAHGATRATDRDAQLGASVLVVFAVSLLAVPLFVGLGWVARGRMGFGIWEAIGLALPGLVLQDIVRWACFVRGHFRLAVGLDALWTMAMFVVFVVLRWTDVESSAPLLMTWWGVSGLVVALGLVVASRMLAVVAHVASTATWLWNASREFIIQAQLSSGLYSMVFIVLGVVGSRSEVASARGATLLFSPLGTIFGGLGIGMLTRLSRPDLTASDRHTILSRLTVASLALVALWTVLVIGLLSLPFTVLGDVQDGVAKLIVFVIAMQIVQSFLLAPTLALKAAGQMQRMRRIRVTAAGLMVVAGGAGAVLDSAGFMLGGLTAAYAISAVQIWPMVR